MSKKYFVSVLCGFIFSVLPCAQAAQNGQVIVLKANVYLYPQASSKVISTLPKGSAVAVSNLPTEGFFKVRLPDGDMGWVSGNDILTGEAANGVAVPAAPGGAKSATVNPTTANENRPRKKNPPRKIRKKLDDADNSDGDSFRFLLGYGVQFLSYGGVKDTFGYPGTLNPGKHFSVEGQIKINPKLYWGIRFAIMNASSGSQLMADGKTNQTISIKQIPVEFGLMWSPVTSHNFRWGIGAYLGADVAGSADVTQNVIGTTTVPEATYSTIELCGDLSTQASYGLGDALGIFIEADYHYEKSGTIPAQTGQFTTPGFAIDYTGVMIHVGLELRL